MVAMVTKVTRHVFQRHNLRLLAEGGCRQSDERAETFITASYPLIYYAVVVLYAYEGGQ